MTWNVMGTSAHRHLTDHLMLLQFSVPLVFVYTVWPWPAVAVWCHDQDNRALHHTTQMKEKMQDCHLSKHNLRVVTAVVWWPRAGKQLLYSQAIHDWTDLYLHSRNSQLCRKYWRDLVWIWIPADLRVTAYQCVAASLAAASKYVGVV